MENYEDLANEGFYGRFDLPTHLTNKVLQVMKRKNLASKDLAAKIYEQMGFGVTGSASSFIGRIRSSHSYSTIPSPFRKSETERKKRQLYKISVLLRALEVQENDPLIQRFKRNYKSFEYPPRQQ